MIRTVIVDDEPLAREGLRARLELERDISVVGEAADGPAAIEAMRGHRPELLFLDIQMPGLDGFDVLRAVVPEVVPVVVVVTAYDRYALQAFEAQALDYLLKPYTGARFSEALRRARHELARQDLSARHEQVRRLLAADGAARRGEPPSPGCHEDRLAVRDGERYVLLATEEIDYVQGAGNYVRLHARGRTFDLRSTLRRLEDRLDDRRFVRIHRSTVVNVDRVAEIVPEWHGDFDIRLDSGTTLRMSRTYRRNLLP